VIKDVQTLKANLKEQEKRARSENGVEEVAAAVPITDQQAPVQDDAGEQRKRRKVSNPAGPTIKESHQEPVLDGPLPATSTESVEPPSNGTYTHSNGAPDAEKDAPVSISPGAKATEPAPSLAPKTTAPQAKATAPSEENKSQAKAASESRHCSKSIPLKSSDQSPFIN
jgi:hypothetical protein